MMNVYDLSGKIFEWTMGLTVVGSIFLVTYAIVATTAYLTLSSRVKSNAMMDRMAKFTGQDAVVTNEGVMRVVGRLMATLLIISFLLSGGGFLLVRIIFGIMLQFLGVV